MHATVSHICRGCALRKLGAPLVARRLCLAAGTGRAVLSAAGRQCAGSAAAHCSLVWAPQRHFSLPHLGGSLGWPRPARAASKCTSAAIAVPRKRKRTTAPGPAPLVVSAGKPVVILGIDPDASGAIAVVQWDTGTRRCANGLPTSLADALLLVHDMPMETIAVGKRNRRQADAKEITALLEELLPALAEDRATVCAVLEQPVPNALNGKFSWFQTGFAYGVWNGVLATYGMPIQVISANRWKRDLQLRGKGKEGSRQLALALYPQAVDLLKRKKDHGRAEALLLAAWASGIELPEEAFAAIEAATITEEEDCSSTDEELPAECAEDGFIVMAP